MPYTTSLKVLYAKALVQGYFYNPRNLENPMHALYGIVFNDLVHDLPNLIPYMQHLLWLPGPGLQGDNRANPASRGHAWDRLSTGLVEPADGELSEEEEESENVESDDEKIDLDQVLGKDTSTDILQQITNDFGTGDLDDLDNEAANMSTATAATQRGNKESDIPDFVLLHLRAHRMPDPLPTATEEEHLRHKRKHGIQLGHACCCVLGEFKRGPPRSLDMVGDTEKHIRIIDMRLAAAFNDLLEYAAHAFKLHPAVKKILVYAASGIYWQTVYIVPKDVPEYNFQGSRWTIPGSAADAILELQDRRSPIFEIGTKESDVKLTEIRTTWLVPLSNDWRVLVPPPPAPVVTE
ncbi:hypothetical protein AAF712_014891 [Marasmius tenuissimus]|uniref:Uncharacterized protein n=1 Tax=Marasmius tenuissimus TaxID=585030 RepID=A0ABR2ZAX7_9AGAR